MAVEKTQAYRWLAGIATAALVFAAAATPAAPAGASSL